MASYNLSIHRKYTSTTAVMLLSVTVIRSSSYNLIPLYCCRSLDFPAVVVGLDVPCYTRTSLAFRRKKVKKSFKVKVVKFCVGVCFVFSSVHALIDL